MRESATTISVKLIVAWDSSKKASEKHQRHLEVAKEVGDKATEGESYGNFDNVYRGIGQFKTAIEYYERQLEIAEVADMAGKGEGKGNLRKDYRSSGQVKTATEYHERQLEIA